MPIVNAAGSTGSSVANVTLDVGEVGVGGVLSKRKAICWVGRDHPVSTDPVVAIRDPSGDAEALVSPSGGFGPIENPFDTTMFVELFYLDLDDALTGSQTFRFTPPLGTGRIAAHVTIEDAMEEGDPKVVEQTTFAGGGTSISDTITTGAYKASIYAGVVIGGGSSVGPQFTPANGQDELADIEADSKVTLGVGRLLEEAAGTYTIGWTFATRPVGVQILAAFAQIDEIAPVLSDGSVEAVSDLSGAGEFTVDEAVDWVAILTESDTEPDPEQVEAGEDENGDSAAAVDSGSASAGTVEPVWTGLTPETAYHAYAVGRDPSGNISEVLYLGTFTTLPPDDGVFIRGEVLHDGVPVEGARVFLIDTQSNPIRTLDTFTDEYGEYLFDGLTDDGREYHVTVQHKVGDALYNSRSQPFLKPE